MSEKVTAFILIKTAVGTEYDIAEKLSKVEGIKDVKVVYGEYDMVVATETDSLKALEEIVMFIRKIKGVEKTSTLIAS